MVGTLSLVTDHDIGMTIPFVTLNYSTTLDNTDHDRP